MTDLLVVGGGVMGLSSAWALTRRRERPVVLERFGRGHTRGASHGATRNVNNAYAEEHYLDLLALAREGWDALGSPDGEPLLRLSGKPSARPARPSRHRRAGAARRGSKGRDRRRTGRGTRSSTGSPRRPR